MKFLDETGLKFIATKFKELRDSLTNKVDKATGKDLSTNDYTNEAKAKVDAIPADPKYTDTVQDLSGYAFKDEFYEVIFSKKIEPDIGWNEEFFPSGAYIYRMFNNTEGTPEKGCYDFIVFTAFNAVIDDDLKITKVNSDIVEQVAVSLKSGRIYERYIDLRYNKNIEYGMSSYKGIIDIPGICGGWTNWLEITKDFAMKDDITKAISTLTTFKKEIVTSLPSAGKDNVFYLIKDANGKDNNNYLEYLWIDNKWEMVGSTQVDLSGYMTKEKAEENEATLRNDFVGLTQYVHELLNKKADKTEIKTKLSEMTDDTTHRLVTDTEKTAWNNKLDSVSGKLPDLKYNTLKNLNPGFYENVGGKLATDYGTLENYDNGGYLFLAPDINGSLFIGFDFLVPGLWVGIVNNDKKNVVWLSILDCLDSLNVKEKLNKLKQQVILTQTEYNALSSTDKNDVSKIYFIKE